MADRGNKDRKRKLETAGEINCGICPYHRKENRLGPGRKGRVPRERLNYLRKKKRYGV